MSLQCGVQELRKCLRPLLTDRALSFKCASTCVGTPVRGAHDSASMCALITHELASAPRQQVPVQWNLPCGRSVVHGIITEIVMLISSAGLVVCLQCSAERAKQFASCGGKDPA